MKKNTILFVLLIEILLTGCTAKLNYKSKKMIDSNNKYTVEIKMKKTINSILSTERRITNKITLYINNEIVLKGNLYEDESGEIQGMYKNKKLNLECSKDSIFSPLFCIVHLGNKHIGESRLEIYQR